MTFQTWNIEMIVKEDESCIDQKIPSGYDIVNETLSLKEI